MPRVTRLLSFYASYLALICAVCRNSPRQGYDCSRGVPSWGDGSAGWRWLAAVRLGYAWRQLDGDEDLVPKHLSQMPWLDNWVCPVWHVSVSATGRRCWPSSIRAGAS